ncbi:alpha-L-rhamnosidase [Pseudactinotalea suaedae]|uniref:alpha-L-rhamnosidase n=1 Tax=Pseudactinotalea suaedae TaxID=1524924 RepID=UPI0012E0F9C6|nr:alpha-L-rhamnosidase [Pseudactinotalea suaedae]
MSSPHPLDPSARWIGRDPLYVPEFDPRSGPQDTPMALISGEPALLLRRVVEIPEQLVSATLRMSARGVYVARLGGRRVDDVQLAPGWTDYHHRITYRTVDVTAHLAPGPQVWSVELGPGWFSGFLGMDAGRRARHYGEHTSVIGELEMRTADGAVIRHVTDDGWVVSDGGTLHADPMLGQMTDPRREPAGWHDPAADQPGAVPAVVTDPPSARFEPQVAPDLVVTDVLTPTAITTIAPGTTLIDLGVNIVGRVRLRIPAASAARPAGAHIHLRHGEALNGDGTLYTENLRAALAHDIAVITDTEWVFDPEFTFHGFRYVEIVGYPGTVTPDDVSGLVIGPRVSTVGSFSCSDQTVNTLHDNVLRTIRNNLVGAPTDCPQRDERLGWMGDASAISATMLFSLDMDDYLASWFVDVRDGQHPNGAFPDVAPRVVVDAEGAPAWADAGVLVPWRHHRYGGPRATLEAHYPAMSAFMDHLERNNPDHYRSRALSRSYGDWLNLDDPTDKALFATAHWALCADAMTAAARALDRADDVERWSASAAAIRDPFAEALLAGGPGRGSQTVLAMAIMGRLVDDPTRAELGARLREAVTGNGTALTTGIHGTRFLLPALSETGSLDVAYALLLRRDYPSWLYAVDRGATTIWERWDGWREDVGFQTPFMNSLNHYALGSVAEWLHEYVAGLRPGVIGWDDVTIRPYPGAALTQAAAERLSPAGRLASAWRTDGESIQLRVTSPAGCRVAVPTTEPDAIDARHARVLSPDPWPLLELPAGDHEIVAPWSPGWVPPSAPAVPGWC